VSTRARGAAYAGASDLGRVRTDNEDTLLMSPPLFAVADGLGGHQAGEVASRLAVDTLLAEAPRKPDHKALGRAVRAANRAVIDAAAEGRGRSGMGTTLTAVMVDGLRLQVAHVGDSRAYLISDGALERLTEDHSMVADLVRSGTLTEEESRVHPNRSVITRALGSDPNMAADTFEVVARPGDRLVLCSDGLSSLVTDDEIVDILSRHQDPAEAVEALIAAARLAGGYDNITAIVVDLEGDVSAEEPAVRAGAWAPRLLWLVAAMALVGLALYGTYAYARGRAYLIDQGGVVAVHRGVPGTFAGVRLDWPEYVSDVRTDRLPPVLRQRLRDGIRVVSMPAADALVAQYRVQASQSTTGPPLGVPVP
jgi:serine/threonine protein phosphatase PrpC